MNLPTILAVGLLYLQGWAPAQQTATPPLTSSTTSGSSPKTTSNTGLDSLSIQELMKRAEANDAAAQNELGVRYQLGIGGVDKDPAAALSWFHKAALQGYGKAMLNLGALSYNGDGNAGDTTLALGWFLLAKDAGDRGGASAAANLQSQLNAEQQSAASLWVGDAYFKGAEVKQDYARAMEWYRTAANSGSGLACHKVALLYSHGVGVPKDNVEIIRWLQRGADLGDSQSAYDLGRAYLQGTGIPGDPEQARKLFEQAAKERNQNAMFSLGQIYEDGTGVKADQQKALMWFLLASEHGSPEGKNEAMALSQRLKPRQVSNAKKEALGYEQQNRQLVLTIHKQN